MSNYLTLKVLGHKEGGPAERADLAPRAVVGAHTLSVARCAHKAYERFLLSAYPFSRSSILDFAEWLGVAPSIIVGRRQHEGRLPHSHLNGLR